jgi:PAS domain-containing protein
VIIPQQASAAADELEDTVDLANMGVLVVNDSPAPNLTDGRIVRVSGTFHEFDLSTFEEELGVDLDYELYFDWTGQPTILAEQIQKQ